MPYHLFGGHLMVNLRWEMLPSHQCDSNVLECAGRIGRILSTHMDTYWQLYVDISENRGFSPQIIHFNRVVHYKASILGAHPYFWKHLCSDLVT